MKRPGLATVQSSGNDTESAHSQATSQLGRPFEDVGNEYRESDEVGEERARELYQ